MKTKSLLYDEASGSIGNLTAAGGNGGQYFKVKSNPRNPNTVNQQVVRNALSGANSAWLAMSTAIRGTWETWASTLGHDNILGNAVTVSGWSAFSGAYVLMTQAKISTASIILGAPATAGYAASGNATLSNDGDVITVETTEVANRKVSVYTSPAQRQTVNNYGGGYQFNIHSDLASGTDVVTTQATIADKRYFAKVQVVENDGRYSKPTILQLDT